MVNSHIYTIHHKKDIKMLEKEICDVFNMLGLANEDERQRILSQGVIEHKTSNKVIYNIIIDNTTKSNQREEQDAKLE